MHGLKGKKGLRRIVTFYLVEKGLLGCTTVDDINPALPIIRHRP